MIRSAIVLLSLAISLSATTINVPADQTTIQAGIDAAVDGDEVLVQAGTYQENINFNGKNIILSSSAGAETTIIQSSSGDAVITGATDSTAALIGFTITSTGLGINAGPGGSTRFEDLIIQNCGNRGMYLNDYHGTIKDVHIKDNLSDYRGGGVHVNSNSDVIFYNVIFSSNSSTPGISGGGLWIENSDALFRNCLLYNNSCGEDGGGLAAYNSNVSLISSTITKNTQPAGRYGAGVAFNTGTFDIINSIIYGNEREGGNPTQLAVSPPAQMNVTHSCVGLSIGAADDPDGLVTLWPGIGNINVDPLFEDSDANDFRLSGQSSCLGNGFDTTGVPTLDLDGQNRPQPAGSSPDMGAYEHSRGRIPLAVPDRFATIQAGINAAVDGDTVLVQPGTYIENINFNGKNIVVGSLFLTTQDTSYISQTVIDGNQGGSVVIFDSGETADAVLTGLTLRNGRANFGGGIHCSNTNPTISNLRINNNEGIGAGGGVYLYMSSPDILNSKISNNISDAGGGVFADQNSNPTIYRSVISNNTSNGLGGGIFGRDGSEINIIRSTLSNNHSTDVGGGLYLESSTCNIELSILSENLPSNAMLAQVGAPNTLNLNYCNIQGGDATLLGDNGMYYKENIIDTPPRFVDSSNQNYRLLASSQCINAGHPDSTDSDGSRADMGAFPYLNTYSGADWHVSVDGSDISGTGEISNPFASIQAGINFAEIGDSVLVNSGTYFENIDLRNHAITVIGVQGSGLTTIDGGESGTVVYVNHQDAADTGLTTLEGFTITNGNGYDNEWGGKSGGGIYCYYANPILRNLIIENNNIPTIPTNQGGGIYFSRSSSLLENVIIRNNSSYQGGGISFSNGSGQILKNVLIESNTVTANGGAAFISATYNGSGTEPVFINCTIANNNSTAYYTSAEESAGGLFFVNGGFATLINSILWGNTPGQAGVFSSPAPSGITLQYSDVEGGFSGIIVDENSSINWFSGNIDAQPQFVSNDLADYLLSDYSPCLGAGVDTTIGPAFDIAGNMRPNPSGSNPDMGAYENPFGTPQHMPITINIPDDYATIQAGLNAADSTDMVLVQPGTYYENIIWPETNGITLLSAGDSSNTIIDGDNNGSVLTINGSGLSIDSTTIIRGFKITNGTSIFYGGGIAIDSVANPILEDLLFVDNSAYYGGAISCKQSSPIITNVIARNNTATEGGAFYFYDYSNATLTDVEVSYNTANKGGGIFCNSQSSPVFELIIVHANTASIGGGGIFAYNQSNMHVNEALVSGNSCFGTAWGDFEGGGGIYSGGGTYPVITNSTIKNNYSAGFGGGYKGYGIDYPTINNVIFINNIAEARGGGASIINTCLPIITNSTFIANQAQSGGGINLESLQNGSIFDRNVLINNTADYGGAIRTNGDPVAITNNTIANNFARVNGDGAWSTATSPAFNQNNIYRNGIGYHNDSDNSVLNLANNYWGDSSGPYHVAYNTGGLGDTTSMFTNPTPFLAAPNLIAPPIPIQNVEVTDSGNDFVSISWEPSPLTDLDSYRLYYGTDTTQYTYANSIDLTTLGTTYTIDGLALSSTYYIAVTCIDTADNESWYSSRIEGVTRAILTQNLDIAGDEDLQHLITHDPLITFDYFDSMGEVQTDYQIQISTDSTFQGGDIWDTGVTTSDATTVQYDQGFLDNGQTYYLRVKVASGAFWSEWSTLSFRMNTEPLTPVQISLIHDAVVTGEVVLLANNSMDAEADAITYDFRLYEDETLSLQLDSAIAVGEESDETAWTVMNSLADNEQFWWTVQAYDGYEYSTLAGPESFLVNTENDIPASFSLLFPGSGEEITSLSPLLSWEPAFDPDPLDTVSYALYLDTPEAGVEIFDLGTDTSYQIVTDLLDNTTYSWKVVASDVNGESTENTGSYISFRINTENDLPTAFDLLAPEDGSMVTDLTPTLVWEPSSDPDDPMLRGIKSSEIKEIDSPNEIMLIASYQVYLDTDSLFADTETVAVINPEYTPDIDLMENQVYYWKIEAVDDDGGSLFSDRWSFWTNAENEAPTEFSLLLPTEGEVLTVLSPTFTWESSSDPDLYDGFGYHILLGSSPEDMDTLWSGEDTTLTLDWELVDNTTYYWSVFTEDWTGLTTSNSGGYQNFTVNTSNDLPEYFELLYPVWDEMVTNLQPEFLWEASSDPDDETIVLRSRGKGPFSDQSGSGNSVDVITGYEFYLSTDSLLTDVVPVEVFDTYYSLAEDLLENQTYYWAVSALDDSGGVTFSDTASFWTNAENEAPEEFSLLLPTEGEVLTVLSPTFTWESSDDPDLYDGFGYHILLGDSPENMDTLWSGEDTTLTLDWELEDNMTYYWSVFAEDWNGLTTFNVGGYQSFTVNTSNDLPLAFDLLSPVAGVMVTNLQPEFLWEASSDPDDETIVMRSIGKGRIADHLGSGNTVDVITGYDFYLGTDVALTDVVPVEVIGTGYTPDTDLTENQVYYWAVSAVDDSGGVTFSDTASFWTNAENEAPEEFALLVPAEGEVLTVLSPTFRWESSSDPDLYDGFGYHILLGSSPEDMDTLWSGEDTTLTLDWELADNTTYYWTVFAEDWNGLTTFNVEGYQSFTVNTSNDLPEYFELLYPVWDEMVVNLQPEFLWEASSDPDDETIAMRTIGKGRLADHLGSGNTVDVITGYDFYLGTDVALTDVVPV
ncbi:MAG: hypothetical protein HOD11_03940, partial [Candidatus Marinimicrobia bacterium]|nr:hypothetical protein [Candidatus Neomarinimicrobiota bacterium]